MSCVRFSKGENYSTAVEKEAKSREKVEKLVMYGSFQSSLKTFLGKEKPHI